MKSAAFVLSLCASLLATTPYSTSASPEQSIAAALQPYVDRHELAGAVTVVASKDKVLSLQTVGYADVAARKLMRSDCLFWIASMSKPIAATARLST